MIEIRHREGGSKALRHALAPAEPTLRAIRDTFRLAWRHSLLMPSQIPTDLSQFRGCARYLYAESLLAQDQGDDSAAIRRKLDGMEMGAKMCRGGEAPPLRAVAGIHAIGFAGAERLASNAPAAGIRQARYVDFIRPPTSWVPAACTLRPRRTRQQPERLDQQEKPGPLAH